MLMSHDKLYAPCLLTPVLNDVWSTNISLQQSDVILINEGQFFGDLYITVLDMLSKNKKVYVCGLDGDFERQKIGQILDLVPYCDKVTKLTSLCSICRDGTPGIFSLRLTDDTSQILIGVDNYIPVCRKCYEIKQNP